MRWVILPIIFWIFTSSAGFERAIASTLVPPKAPHPSASLSASDAYDEGARLQQLGRHLESVAYFQRAVEEFPSAWNFHRDLATALHNASIEMRNDFGYVEYRLPSSLDRAHFGMQALSELQLAETLAPNAAARRDAHDLMDRVLQIWGFRVP